MSSRNQCPVLLNASLVEAVAPVTRTVKVRHVKQSSRFVNSPVISGCASTVPSPSATCTVISFLSMASVELHRTTALNETTMSVGVEPSDASAGVVSTPLAAKRTYPMEAVTVPETLQPSGAS